VSTLDRDGVHIRYDVHVGRREATPLLLSHGYGASRAMWRPNLDALVATRSVVTWDMRGHGDSDSPANAAAYSHALTVTDMVAILDACGVERAAVGGLSLGGYVSLDFYRLHPDRVRCLLLFDTGPGFKNDVARRRWNDYAHDVASRLEADGVSALSTSPEVAHTAADTTGLALAARGMLAQRNGDVIASLSTVKVPTLVLVGADDTNFLPAADYMAATIPNAEKVVVPAAGHAANIDQPDVFNDAVISFLRRHESLMP
jgi:pimeloyl-ACP methyl ester carboxylesterase